MRCTAYNAWPEESDEWPPDPYDNLLCRQRVRSRPALCGAVYFYDYFC